MTKIELIDDLIKRVENLPHRDSNGLDALKRRAEMVMRKVFGAESKYIKDLYYVSFYPNYAPVKEEDKNQIWRDGQQHIINLFNTMKEELLLFGLTADEKRVQVKSDEQSNEIFVVHGHDETMKQAVARTLEKLELRAIILHEKPNQGRTIIEKFTNYSQVHFAVVLLSPDDVAHTRNAKPEEARYRARQNVIFELGYFVGKLGRERVVVLYREDDSFEMPSDYSGVLFVPFDHAGRWQFDLVRELKACGYSVDANKLMG
ncbi:MAG TPA: nucleotide-binding protein [Thermodesulfobacteriota bacterium]|nr:nucleotide-binding protein [Thermodesulfobacteriota bacterium]